MSRYAPPCSTDLRCCRNDGHEGDHLYPAIPDFRAAIPDAPALRTALLARKAFFHCDDCMNEVVTALASGDTEPGETA